MRQRGHALSRTDGPSVRALAVTLAWHATWQCDLIVCYGKCNKFVEHNKKETWRGAPACVRGRTGRRARGWYRGANGDSTPATCPGAAPAGASARAGFSESTCENIAETFRGATCGRFELGHNRKRGRPGRAENVWIECRFGPWVRLV